MPDFLSSPLSATTPIAPIEVLARLLIAVAFGGIVAWVYRRTRAEHLSTFPATLVLLSVLIAMVTQVIGDSVARAFSLVGALSIVRFRTVVRDTQDTAFVIFSVVVGMACGASDPRVALIGIFVVGGAAFLMRPKTTATQTSEWFTLEVRVGTAVDAETTVVAAIGPFVAERRLISLATAKQGTAIELVYAIHLVAGQQPDALVKALNRTEGVQSVNLIVRNVEEPSA